MSIRKIYLSINFFLLTGLLFAQEDSNQITKAQLQLDHKKLTTVSVVHAGLYGGSMIGLYSTWYKNYPQSKFHVFNDWEEWQKMDKIGHLYSAYTMSRFSMELWKSTGMERKKRIWLGGLTGAAYQTIIETLDGFSSEWGWSWGDIGANIIGSASLISQELLWNEQRLQIKTSFHKKVYDDDILNQRSNIIFGKSLAERCLKDYNGQTYWISANIKSFFPESKIPKWLEISVGTGAEGMFGARENFARDKDGNIIFDRKNISRVRQWYLAPDVDFTKIKTKSKIIKSVFFVLNSLKFPTPALELSNGKLKWNWIAF